MAKFRGAVGYSLGVQEKTPGNFDEVMEERIYRGDVVRNSRQIDSSEQLNVDISVSNSLSIVADAYAREHFFAMRYVRWAGACWTIDDVEVQSPRLLLRLGGVWNGNTVGSE